MHDSFNRAASGLLMIMLMMTEWLGIMSTVGVLAKIDDEIAGN